MADLSPDGAAAKATGEIAFERWATIDATFSFRDAFLAGWRARGEADVDAVERKFRGRWFEASVPFDCMEAQVAIRALDAPVQKEEQHE